MHTHTRQSVGCKAEQLTPMSPALVQLVKVLLQHRANWLPYKGIRNLNLNKTLWQKRKKLQKAPPSWINKPSPGSVPNELQYKRKKIIDLKLVFRLHHPILGVSVFHYRYITQSFTTSMVPKVQFSIFLSTLGVSSIWTHYSTCILSYAFPALPTYNLSLQQAMTPTRGSHSQAFSKTEATSLPLCF